MLKRAPDYSAVFGPPPVKRRSLLPSPKKAAASKSNSGPSSSKTSFYRQPQSYGADRRKRRPNPEVAAFPRNSYGMPRHYNQRKMQQTWNNTATFSQMSHGAQSFSDSWRPIAVTDQSPSSNLSDVVDVHKLVDSHKRYGWLEKFGATPVPDLIESKGQSREANLTPKESRCSSLVWYNHNGNLTERGLRMATLLENADVLSDEFLMRRYDSVVESIHKPRSVCNFCDIAIKDVKSESYRRHLDAHAQRNLAIYKNDYNRCRPWFMTQDWFDFSETEAANSTVSQDAAKTLNDTKDVCSEDASLKECFACKDRFDEYYDHGSDIWRLRNSIEDNGTLLHRTCVNVQPKSQFSTAKGSNATADENAQIRTRKFSLFDVNKENMTNVRLKNKNIVQKRNIA